MLVGIATDHGGFPLKEDLVAHLKGAGYQVHDFGACAQNPDDDYPDFVIPLAQAVAGGQVDRGIAIWLRLRNHAQGIGSCRTNATLPRNTGYLQCPRNDSTGARLRHESRVPRQECQSFGSRNSLKIIPASTDSARGKRSSPNRFAALAIGMCALFCQPPAPST